MAKMLGQDIHTQKEFDEFHHHEFSPLKGRVEYSVGLAEKAESKAASLNNIAFGAVILSMISLAVNLVLVARVFFH